MLSTVGCDFTRIPRFGSQARLQPEPITLRENRKLMDENKRKQIEAKLIQLFTQTDGEQNPGSPTRVSSSVVKVIRRRKGKPDLQVA